MKKIIVALLLATFGKVTAQDVVQDSIKAPISIDSLKQSIDDHTMRLGSIDERLAAAEGELYKLTKIKVSGYLQAQWDKYEFQDDLTPASYNVATSPTAIYEPVKNTFSIRRARVKFTYEALDGIKFVVQPDFAFDKVTLRDCYAVLNDRWLNTFSLTVGQFNRLNYDVEFSSGTREFLERSRIAVTLYPQERDLGAKLEANFTTRYEIPLKLQFALFNGNFGTGTEKNQSKDLDNNKDIMMRGTYSFKFPSTGLGIDVGTHAYFGHFEVLKGTSAPKISGYDNVDYQTTGGDVFPKKWYGAEAQIYYDFLGGMAIKGEFIQGQSATTANTNENYTVLNSVPSADKIRHFNGWYISWTKNIGKRHQFATRFDRYDPNVRLDGNDVTRADDLRISTWNFGWQYFFDEHVKVVLSYNIPMNEQSDNIKTTYKYNNVGNNLDPALFNTSARDYLDNTFTIRLQAKF